MKLWVYIKTRYEFLLHECKRAPIDGDESKQLLSLLSFLEPHILKEYVHFVISF